MSKMAMRKGSKARRMEKDEKVEEEGRKEGKRKGQKMSGWLSNC